MKAGEAVEDSVSAAISEVLNQMFYSKSPLSLASRLCVSPVLSSFVSLKHTICFFLRPLSLFVGLVNSVINHPVTVTELLLIVILQLPCLIVFVP